MRTCRFDFKGVLIMEYESRIVDGNGRCIARECFGTCELCPMVDTESNTCRKQKGVKANYKCFPYDCPLHLGGEFA